MSTTHRERSPRVGSPSPYRESRRHRSDRHLPHTRTRSRSPHRESNKHDRHHKHRSPPRATIELPYHARKLSKNQYEEYKPLFQSYLDIQKHLNLDELEEREARGRWKSFVSHWNRGELARSWYDPSMLKTAQETVSSFRKSSPERRTRDSPVYTPAQKGGDEEEESDDEFGPAAPKDLVSLKKTGPTMPKMDDLALRDQLREEERARDGSHYRDDMRYERKLERKANKDRLEELVPRADAGTRERLLEKKRETTSTLKDFGQAKESGDVEVGESDLMGDDGVDAYKKMRKEGERKKNEREIRREEIMMARAAEREERLSEIRQKEAATMEYLKQIAKANFG